MLAASVVYAFVFIYQYICILRDYGFFGCRFVLKYANQKCIFRGCLREKWKMHSGHSISVIECILASFHAYKDTDFLLKMLVRMKGESFKQITAVLRVFQNLKKIQRVIWRFFVVHEFQLHREKSIKFRARKFIHIFYASTDCSFLILSRTLAEIVYQFQPYQPNSWTYNFVEVSGPDLSPPPARKKVTFSYDPF
jgi:hypothetical protein